MAHELDRNDATGKAAIFSVRETPWHREGILLGTAPTFEEALRLGGLDFEVELRPVFTGGADGQPVVVPDVKAIVRLDRGEQVGQISPLTVVGADYEPLQNRDAFGVLEPLLDQGVLTLETGGSLRRGRDVWMLAKFDVTRFGPVVREVFAEEVIPFTLVTNNHAGEARAIVMLTPVRVVCANTLGMALVNWRDRQDCIAITHRGDARVRLIEAAEGLLGSIIERYELVARQYRTMKATIITVEQFTASVLDVVAPYPGKVLTPGGDHLTTRGYDIAYEVAQNRRLALTSAWTEGAGHSGDHSAWEAYNGAVEVLDHDVALFKSRGSRVASLLGGRLAERKRLVANSVGRLCGLDQLETAEVISTS